MKNRHFKHELNISEIHIGGFISRYISAAKKVVICNMSIWFPSAGERLNAAINRQLNVIYSFMKKYDDWQVYSLITL